MSCWIEKNNSNVWTWTINTSSWNNNTSSGKIDSEILKIDEVLLKLMDKNDVLANIKAENDSEYLNELTLLNNYYTDKAEWWFYLELAIFKKDKEICNKISEQENLNLCSSIVDNMNNTNFLKKELFNNWIKDWKEIEEAIYYFEKISKNDNCNNLNIIKYLSCKKLNDKNFNVEDYLLKYKTLEYSNQDIVRKYYLDILNNWKTDSDFKDTVEILMTNAQ